MPPVVPVPQEGPFDPRLLAEVADVLRTGGLVILPTDTVYGLAADPFRPGAEARLARAKRRSDGKPIPLLACDAGRVVAWPVDLGPVGRALAARFWPGALTLVVRAGAGWEGFRVPAHAAARAVLEAAGGVLRVTSANRSGQPPALTAAAAVAAVGAEAGLALDAGPAPGGIASTVVRVGPGICEVLREGGVPAAAVRDAAAGAGE